MKAPEEILTERLILSPPTAADAAAVFERYASSREVTRYLGWPWHRSLADTHIFLNFSAEEWRRWPAGPYLIRLRRNGQVIGSTGFGFEAPDRAVTGYVLAKDAWGNGFATEALGAMVALAPRLGIARLYALCHPEHLPSSRVLEKCGFSRDRSWSTHVEFPNLAPGSLQDVLCYAITFNTSGAG